MKTLLLCFLLVLQTHYSTLFAQDHYMLVGTYDSPKSEGIYVYRFNKDGTFKKISHVRASNPSYLAVSENQEYVYAVLENAKAGRGGEVAAYSFDKTNGTLTLINQQSSEGDHPCYVEIDKTGRWIFVANYSSGNMAVLPVQADGSLGKATTVISYEGKGPDSVRQKSPHVHSTVISPDNKWLYVTDLGTDRIMIYAFDASTGKLTTAPEHVTSRPGSGPRHFAFHPSMKIAYMLGELDGYVVAYRDSSGMLLPFQVISTKDNRDSRFTGSADIHPSPDGKFLYATNRGEFNNIVIFRINRVGGLIPYSNQSTLGKGPRNFNFDPGGKYLLVGNQQSDEIVIFKRNKKTGLLADSGNRVSLGKPVCIKWISSK